jgi:hypothetical protein
MLEHAKIAGTNRQASESATLSLAPVTQAFLATSSSTSVMQLLADPLEPCD